MTLGRVLASSNQRRQPRAGVVLVAIDQPGIDQAVEPASAGDLAELARVIGRTDATFAITGKNDMALFDRGDVARHRSLPAGRYAFGVY
ncbi:MAG: hypothetical protein ACXW3X_10170 [Rhodoplanes sp.]